MTLEIQQKSAGPWNGVCAVRFSGPGNLLPNIGRAIPHGLGTLPAAEAFRDSSLTSRTMFPVTGLTLLNSFLAD